MRYGALVTVGHAQVKKWDVSYDSQVPPQQGLGVCLDTTVLQRVRLRDAQGYLFRQG